MSPQLKRPTPTFWIVLACGAVCGAATAATGASPTETTVLPATQSPAPALPAAEAPAVAPDLVDAAPVPAPEPLVLRSGPTAQAQGPETPATPGPGGWGELIALLALAGAGLAVALHWRRSQRDSATAPLENLEVVSTARVAGRWQVALMKVPGRLLVVGAGSEGLSVLAELDPAETWDEDAPTLPTQEPPPVLDLSATYRRPTPRQQAPAPPPRREATAGDDDAFLDHLMDRLAKAQPAVIRAQTGTAPARQSDEREVLRKRVAHLRRGPTRI